VKAKDGVHLFVKVDTMSEKSAEVVPGLIVKPGLNGRRTYSVTAKRALAQLCSRPGVSVARMALTHGVNANLLRRWMIRYADPKAAVIEAAPLKGTVPALLPVTTRVARATRTSINLDSCIEIEFAAARIRVRGVVDARALGVVLDCLAQRA
jgi:transposase